MPTVIHLVRHCPHGDVGTRLSGRANGRPLTAEGFRQAEQLAARFERGSVAKVQASPQLRAQQTAKTISVALGCALEIEPALDEVDFGNWTGLAFKELEGDPEWQQWNCERASARPPNGESMAEALSRATTHLEKTVRQLPAGALVCVTHCDIIRAIIAHYLGLSLDHLLRFDIDPGSVSTIELAPWGGRVLMVNGEGPKSVGGGELAEVTAKEPA